MWANREVDFRLEFLEMERMNDGVSREFHGGKQEEHTLAWNRTVKDPFS